MDSVVARMGGRRALSSLGNGWATVLRDEADWIYSGEWWGSHDGGFGRDEGQTVFQRNSLKGNGLVSVTAHAASIPMAEHWPLLETKLQKKYERLLGVHETHERIRISGYQWRVLRFNNITRESVAKVMFVYIDSDPNRVFLMQQPHCLAFPCAFIDVIEIDEAVISASIGSMGFPAVFKTNARTQEEYSEHSSCGLHVKESQNIMHKVLWDDIQERLFLYEADGEAYICDSINNSPDKEGSELYDMVFIDAYDGDDIFPYKFRDRSGPFLTALRSKLHPRHGTVIVNLHMDSSHATLHERWTENYSPTSNSYMPLGGQNLKVCKSYRDALRGTYSLEAEPAEFSLAFTATVPFLQNLTLVVTRGFSPVASKGSRREVLEKLESNGCLSKKLVLEKLIQESQTVEELFNLPFNCFQFVRRCLFIVS